MSGILAGLAGPALNTMLTQALIQQNRMQMAESTAQSMVFSAQEHQQQMMNATREHLRALNNNNQEQATQELKDAETLMKKVTTELGQAAAAG